MALKELRVGESLLKDRQRTASEGYAGAALSVSWPGPAGVLHP